MFGPYRLVSLLGRGGMGEVWRALDTRKGRHIALKVLGSWHRSDQSFVPRFRREAALAAQLTTPHVVPIHDYGEIDGQLFIDMALIDGVDLATLLERDGPLPPDRAVDIIGQAASALDVAHAAGLIHRDVKPSNILIHEHAGADYVYLIDFGIAREVDSTKISLTGSVLGTPAYMAPERFDGISDQAGDVYALTCVLYEALTGRAAFSAPSVWGYVKAHGHDVAPAPSAVRPGLPRRLDNVVAGGLAKAARDRFRSAGEMATAAQAAVERPPSVRNDVAVSRTASRRAWSNRWYPRNWPLKWKLAVIGLLPALLALSLGALRVADHLGDAADLGRNTRLLDVQQQVAEAADAVREERNDSVLFIAQARGGDTGVLDLTFRETTAQIEEMLAAVHGTTDLDASTAAILQQAESELNDLQVLRDDVTANEQFGISRISERYTTLVEVLDVLDRALLRQLRTPGTAGLADALTAASSLNEQLAVQHTVVAAGIVATQLQPGDANTVVATENRLTSDFREYQVALTPEQLTRFGNFLNDPANAQRNRLWNAALSTPVDISLTVAAADWDAAFEGSRAAANRSVELLRTELVDQSAAAEESATSAGIGALPPDSGHGVVDYAASCSVVVCCCS